MSGQHREAIDSEADLQQHSVLKADRHKINLCQDASLPVKRSRVAQACCSDEQRLIRRHAIARHMEDLL